MNTNSEPANELFTEEDISKYKLQDEKGYLADFDLDELIDMKESILREMELLENEQNLTNG